MALDDIRVKIHHSHILIEDIKFEVPGYTFLRELLPRGANGLVFETINQRLERKEALKIWIPRKEDSRDRHTQALAEARKLAKLSHNNIVPIFTCDEFENGWVYVTMEFLEGITLKDLLMHKLDYWQCRNIWEAIYDALSYSHSKGVYHGDLHPGNEVVVGEHTKLIDFGTSIYSSLDRSRARATEKLIDICETLFSGFPPSFSTIIENEAFNLKPELALLVANTWVKTIRTWGELKQTSSHDRDHFRRELHSLATDLSSTPMFAILKVIEELKKEGFSLELSSPLFGDRHINSLVYFMGCCINWARARIFYLQNKDIDVYNEGTPLDEGYNKETITTVWSELQAAFIERGPF